MSKTKAIYYIFFFCVILFTSCENNYAPKPKGYFRIGLPKKEYTVFDSVYPYKFEYPVYAKIVPDTDFMAEPFWINIDYPQFKAKIHISYKHIKNNLPDYIKDTRTLVNKHISKADAIDTKLFVNNKDKVYGITYDIKGINTASPFQFFVTDSVTHFIRGALYFNIEPNNDSLSPVIDFIKNDIEYIINTLQWKIEPACQ